MCGRFVVSKQLADLKELFESDAPAYFETQSFNIAPTNSAPIVVEREIEGLPSREIHPARFGLIPHWAKEVPSPLFNARMETVLEKPSFRDAALKKRCVVPASGYFEWDSEKQPHYIFSDPVLCFAGIFSFWRDPTKDQMDPSRWVLSFSILTKPASDALSWVHERSPVFLSDEGVDAWLSPDYETTPDLLEALGHESDTVARSLQHHPVSKSVGKVSENSIDLISRISL